MAKTKTEIEFNQKNRKVNFRPNKLSITTLSKDKKIEIL